MKTSLVSGAGNPPDDWTRRLSSLYEKAKQQQARGVRDAARLFTVEEQRELQAIGARPIELYDYAEDASALDWETALLILAVRRDYFLNVQHGKPSPRRLAMEAFPAKNAELEGIRWLPRLICKATARLRGELPDALMYCCGGDRAFFKKYGLHPADFLRFVWSVDGDETKIAARVRGGA